MNLVRELGLAYVIVFFVTLLPAGWFVMKAIESIKTRGRLHSKTLAWLVLAVLTWFSPSLITGALAVLNGAPALFFVILLGLVVLGLGSFKRAIISKERKQPVNGKVAEVLFTGLLLLAERFLQVQFLSPDDKKAIELITRFRGEYVTWAESKGTGGVPKEVDIYDTQPTTIHVAVFLKTPLKDWLIGYGRLLFGCQQILEKYTHVLGEAIQFEHAVELSRLLVIPKIYGYQIRGKRLSALVQLLIYRKFFQACESRGVTEWWAVLGKGLLRMLNSFGFPFRRINDLDGKDAAGTYFAVRMNIEEGRETLRFKSPILYSWFCAVENQPVGFTRMNGRQMVPVSSTVIQGEISR